MTLTMVNFKDKCARPHPGSTLIPPATGSALPAFDPHGSVAERLLENPGARLVSRVADATRATVNGTVAAAIVEGAVIGIADAGLFGSGAATLLIRDNQPALIGGTAQLPFLTVLIGILCGN
jgi:hypothetical protein